jgi:hypothetical protein
MKKIVIFEAMFFLFLSFAFADEKPGQLENTGFKTDFIHLNPIFFPINNYSLMDLLENNSRLLNSENSQVYSINIQERTYSFNVLFFFAGILADLYHLDLYTLNRENHGAYDSLVEKQKEDKLYRGIFHGVW